MQKPQDPISRRRVFKTAGAAGALAAVAAAVPLVQRDPQQADRATDKPAPSGAAGYRTTEHVLRYYETTRT